MWLPEQLLVTQPDPEAAAVRGSRPGYWVPAAIFAVLYGLSELIWLIVSLNRAKGSYVKKAATQPVTLTRNRRFSKVQGSEIRSQG
jgi:hypothetical protein